MTSPFPALEHSGLQLQRCGQAGLSSPDSSADAGDIPGCVLDLLGAVPVLCPCCVLLPLIYHFIMSALQLRSSSWSSSWVTHGDFPSVGSLGFAGSCSRVCSSSISIPAAPPSSRSVPAPSQALPGTLPRGICSQIRRNKGENHSFGVCRGLMIPIHTKPWAAELSWSPAPRGARSLFEQGLFLYPSGKCCCLGTRGGTCRKSSWCWARLCSRAPGEDGSGLWLPGSCQCAELDPGVAQEGVGRSFPSLLGRCRKSQGPGRAANRLWSCLQNSCFASSSPQPSFFLQIRPGIYCSSFLLPCPDFWAVLPLEETFGRLRGSCHASKHPSGTLPASVGFSQGRFQADLSQARGLSGALA